MSEVIVHPGETLVVDGCRGVRHWVEQAFPLTGHEEIDTALAGFPVAVFRPERRRAIETPVVFALQGLAAPYQWNSFLIRPLIERGIACALFDHPLAGERSLSRSFRGDIVRELQDLAERRVRFGSWALPRVMEAVSANFVAARALLDREYGLGDERVALFGVSMGCLLSSYAFCRHAFGARLLGVIGHADLIAFAASYCRFGGAGNLAKTLAGSAAARFLQAAGAGLFPRARVTVSLFETLHQLRSGDEHARAANPMSYVDRVGADRRARFLVGEADGHVSLADVAACVERFPDGAYYPVPGLRHGQADFGPSFAEHATTFALSQLADWAG